VSGSTIGGVIGAVIGSFIPGVGTSIGWMIGSAIGGYVDPDVVKGPRLTDAQTQTSMEGVPRPIVYGTACIAGNLIQVGPLVESKHRERSGKGGPVQQTYTYSRTVAIRICEAAPLGGEMQLRRVWMDDKLVYDVSAPPPDTDLTAWQRWMATMHANNTKFASILTFYPGSETQLPDPSLEALPAEYGGGVGNVPAYRGTCYAVLTNLDVTDRQGSIPNFRWEVCSDADTTNASAEYEPLDFDGYSPWQQDAPTSRDPRKNGVTYQYAALGFNDDYTNPAIPWRDDVATAIADAETKFSVSVVDDATLMGWTTSVGGFNPAQPIAPWEDITTGSHDWHDRYVLGLVYSRYSSTAEGTAYIYEAGGTSAGSGACSYYPTPVWAAVVRGNGTGSTVLHRNVTLQQGTLGPSGSDVTFNCYDGATYNASGLNGYSGFIIACRPSTGCYHNPPADALPVPDAPGFYIVNGEVRDYSQTCTTVTSTFKQLAPLDHSLDGGTLGTAKINAFPLGPVLESGDPNYDVQAYWDDAYTTAVEAGLMPAGMTYSATGLGSVNTYPRGTSQACQCATVLGTVSPNFAPLDEVVADICDRGTVTELDVTALAGRELRGLALANVMAAADALRELQKVKFFDLPEWGDNGDVGTKLHAVPRGGAVAVTLSDDDLLQSDDEEETRAQQVEFPRKLHLIAPDPDANYEPIKQTFERVTENVKATGEVSLQTAVVMTRDECAQTAEIMGKVAWEEALGRKTVEVPEAYSIYTPSDIVQLGKRWRLSRSELGDGESKWELVRDRASAYVSTAAGSQTITPTPPPSSLRGPTILQVLNLPSLRPTDTVPGVYLAACGVLAGWAGADIYLQIDGQEVVVATLYQPAAMGVLTDAIGTSGEPLSIQLHNDDELDSASATQVAAGVNRFAITADDTSEVCQFATPTDTGVKTYDLSDLSRGVLGSTVASHSAGDAWCLLDQAVVFLPLDVQLAGQTLTFRAVSRGTVPAKNPTQTFVYRPQFTSVPVADFLVTDLAENIVTDAGDYLQALS
jgi:hypothetical protein